MSALNLLFFSVNDKPKFEKPLRDRFCKDGSSVTLECVISGNPRPRTAWFREGEEILDCQVSVQLLVYSTPSFNTVEQNCEFLFNTVNKHF